LVGRFSISWEVSWEFTTISVLRIDVPCEPPATQFYAPSAVYTITPSDEATARLVAKGSVPSPVQRWQLPAADEYDDGDVEDDPIDPDDLGPF
jgi:hypothetical protein